MIEVEIWSDFACPFCYIGKKNFEKALSLYDQKDSVQVIYRSFELDPTAEKSQKVSIYEVLAKKYGRSLEWAKQANENVIAMGKEAGIHFAIEKIVPTNSFDAHRLAHLARHENKQAAWQEALFAAYFIEGQDIADFQVLLNLAQKVGLSETETQSVLNSQKFADQVRHEEAEAQEIGINGVPFFVFNRKFGISGAQPAEVLIDALKQAQKN